jgi:PAS domain S-box-containing protein
LNPIVLLDESRRVVAANSAVHALLGYRAGDLTRRQIDELIASPHRAQRDKEWRHLLETGEQSGIHVYRRRDGSQIEIGFAIRSVRFGQRELFVGVVLPLVPVTLAREVGHQTSPLTAREREVVALIALGQETSSIAQTLFISVETVRTHIRNAMAKLGVHNRAGLVAIAFTRGELLAPVGATIPPGPLTGSH